MRSLAREDHNKNFESEDFLGKTMGLGKMLILELVTFVAVILSGMGAAAVAFQIAKPNCEDRCGDVEIPYPFGTTKGCYLNEDFFMRCNDSSGHPPELTAGINLTVTKISMDGELDILMYIAHQCYENGVLGYNNNPWLNYPAFTVSNTKNKFFTIGCDTYAYLNAFRNNERFSIGCMSICRSLQNVESGSCTGIGCCQVEIPKGLKNFTLDARSYHNHTNVSEFNPCSFAFVTRQEEFDFSSDYLKSLRENETYPMVLDWAIGDEKCETAQNKSDYVCGGNSSCDNPPDGVDGYRCRCKEGYDGNPYLPHGCQDINECEADPKPCNVTTSKCNNTDGNFTCICLDGYEGDGKIINGTGCRLKAGANQSGINIIIPLELLTGKKALCFDRPEKDRSLAMFFNSAIEEDCLHQIIDDQIVNEGNINAINEVAKIAKWCLSVKGEDRPTMKEVAMELEGLRILGKHPWVKADLYMEETEYLLGAPTHSFNIDINSGSSSTITTVGFESMKNQVVKPLNDGR